MKKIKLGVWIVTLSIAAMGLAGCGKKTEVETEATTEMTTEASVEQTTEATTEEIRHEGIYNDLTGVWETDRTEPYGRPISVMMNNISDAMPQCGIGEADVVYEMVVEGSITRLLAIFSDYSNIERLGSIRSCRPYYVTVSMEYDAIYMHYGQSPQGETKLETSGIDNLSGLSAEGNVTYYRSTDRVAPHNVFTNPEMIQAGIDYMGYSTEHYYGFESMFSFHDEITPLEGGETANKITTDYKINHPWFEYHADDGLYYRFQYNTEHIDGNTNEQIAFENIIVQFAHYSDLDSEGRQQIDLVGSGSGLYATNGKIIPITWQKTSENAQTKFFTEDGEELLLNPGKTWVAVFESENTNGVTWE